MRGINQAMLIGYLGSDPDIRHSPDGRAVATLSLATTSSWKDKTTGELQEATEWHRVVLFNRLAQIAEQYLRKGALIYVEGPLQTKQWSDKDGNNRHTTQVVGRKLEMLSGKNQQSAPQSEPGANWDAPIFDDELPF